MSFTRKAGAIVLGLSLSTFGVTFAQARDHDSHCQDKIRKAEEKLHRDEQKHGEHSRQAEKDRRAVENARAKCDMRDRDHDRH